MAVGDPLLGHWKHAGLMQKFCHGEWTAVPVLPNSFAVIYKKLLTVYDSRLDADYELWPSIKLRHRKHFKQQNKFLI